MRRISTANATLVVRSSASGKPRSTNALPEPTSIGIFLLLLLAIARLVIGFCGCKPLVHEFDILPCRLDSRRRFLLKAMQNVNRVLEPDCVDRPIRVAAQVFDDLQHPRTDTFPGLRSRMPSAELRHSQRPTNLFN